MTTEAEVSVSIVGEDVAAGRLYAHRRRGVESATFVYDESYLRHSGAYPLDPALPLVSGSLQTPTGLPLFNAFTDSAPDRWGRNLIVRNERTRASLSGNRSRSLGEVDFLLGARDDVRQGALRFRDPQTGAFLADTKVGVPAATNLPELLEIAARVETETAGAAELARLVQAGSSLGGARPKTHVLATGGVLAIAKFPSVSADTWDVMAWEKVALDLAEAAGIQVPRSDLIDFAGRAVLILHRFDRTADNQRIGYRSALTMLEARDGDQRSYLDIGEVIEEQSPFATRDLSQLWRRMVFNVLISNTDDHLRNHAFLHTDKASWRLSPAFDLNPNPDPGPKYLSTAIDEFETAAKVDLLLDVIPYFRLDTDAAVAVVSDVVGAIAGWKATAGRVGISRHEIERMEPAFSHEAADQAASLT